MKSVVDETRYKAASKKLNKRQASNASISSVVDDSQKAQQDGDDGGAPLYPGK